MEARASVSTGENAVDARIVEALVSVSTGDDAVNARIVEALASVSTGDNAVNARIVEARASVSTGDDAVNARIVEAGASVSTGEYGVNARVVKVRQNESWFPRSESEVSTRRRCAMMKRTPTSALSAWTPLVKCRHRYHTDCRAELEKAGFEGCSYRCEGSALASSSFEG